MSFRARSIKALIRNRGNRTEGQIRSVGTASSDIIRRECSLLAVLTRFLQGPGRAQSHGARVSDQSDHWMRRAPLCFSTVPSVEVQPGFSPTVSWGYDGEESATHPVYFSHKARVVYRHQMDGNIIDATC
ncbi:LOW QUALITY PROTEIN: uncharacterized protein si:ch211-237l4.6 [Rhinichthys klamathensis goyatoka]|uniref:LOW QUALITY PROTEIN: uncharacterized protein si:ch211-237l4.6 n=1 Tax=Rhinichthys klamathensis goyatoka TaxID=3034132 RepID=UPI0024B5E11B|nr:LOW QUALITY PROTEIN: uncharacterized protein si:ch211-237l4.6 [Rhinichthys klamathensis goyatoka]